MDARQLLRQRAFFDFDRSSILPHGSLYGEDQSETGKRGGGRMRSQRHKKTHAPSKKQRLLVRARPRRVAQAKCLARRFSDPLGVSWLSVEG